MKMTFTEELIAHWDDMYRYWQRRYDEVHSEELKTYYLDRMIWCAQHAAELRKRS